MFFFSYHFLIGQPICRVLSALFFQQLKVQFSLVLGFVGVHCADVLLGLYLITAFHGDVFEVGINGEVLAMSDDDDSVGTYQFGHAGNLTIKHSASLGPFGGGDIDAVVGYCDFAGYH